MSFHALTYVYTTFWSKKGIKKKDGLGNGFNHNLINFVIIDLGRRFPHFLRKIVPLARLFIGINFTRRTFDEVSLAFKYFGAGGG